MLTFIISLQAIALFQVMKSCSIVFWIEFCVFTDKCDISCDHCEYDKAEHDWIWLSSLHLDTVLLLTWAVRPVVISIHWFVSGYWHVNQAFLSLIQTKISWLTGATIWYRSLSTQQSQQTWLSTTPNTWTWFSWFFSNGANWKIKYRSNADKRSLKKRETFCKFKFYEKLSHFEFRY